MFLELKENEPGSADLTFMDITSRHIFALRDQWEFAASVANVVTAHAKTADAMADAAENMEDVGKWEEAEAVLNRAMADAFWYETKEFNTRDNVGLIHRFKLIELVNRILKAENGE
jgi:hypothetical protein